MQLGSFDYVQFPMNIRPGMCKRCGGSKRYRVQNDGGEVRYYPCDHCNETGIEPPSLWQRISRWL